MNDAQAKQIFDSIIRGHWENWPAESDNYILWPVQQEPVPFGFTKYYSARFLTGIFQGESMNEPTARHEDILRMKCEKCNTEWDEHYSLPMCFQAFIGRLKLRCPHCGATSKHIIILDKSKEAKP